MNTFDLSAIRTHPRLPKSSDARILNCILTQDPVRRQSGGWALPHLTVLNVHSEHIRSLDSYFLSFDRFLITVREKDKKGEASGAAYSAYTENEKGKAAVIRSSAQRCGGIRHTMLQVFRSGRRPLFGDSIVVSSHANASF